MMQLTPKGTADLTKAFKVDAKVWERAETQATFALANMVRKFVAQQWRTAPFKRGGKGYHRKAIVRSVTSKVRRLGSTVEATIGLRRRDKYVNVANIIDPGFTHRGGKVIAGKHIRRRGYEYADTVTPLFEAELALKLDKLLSAGRPK